MRKNCFRKGELYILSQALFSILKLEVTLPIISLPIRNPHINYMWLHHLPSEHLLFIWFILKFLVDWSLLSSIGSSYHDFCFHVDLAPFSHNHLVLSIIIPNEQLLYLLMYNTYIKVIKHKVESLCPFNMKWSPPKKSIV